MNYILFIKVAMRIRNRKLSVILEKNFERIMNVLWSSFLERAPKRNYLINKVTKFI